MHILLLIVSLLPLSNILIGEPRTSALPSTPVYTTPLDSLLFVQNTQVPAPVGSFNSVPRFSNGTLKLIKNSKVYIDDDGNVQLNGIIKNNHILTWPSTCGTAGQALVSDGMCGLTFGSAVGGGNVSTASVFTTDNALVKTDLADGPTNVQDSTVILDASNNMSGLNTVTATTFIGDLNGNAASTTNFTGTLSGDVTGTQNATVVSSVGGQTAANVAAAAILANAATDANTANAIVRRDASGNFSAGTITANLTGTVTGSSSLNVLKAGDTMTGTLVHPAGTAAAPSIQFSGSTNTGISAPATNTLSFDTNGAERLNIGATGTITIDGFSTAGVVHNNASGELSSSPIVNADVSASAAIADTKLATITSAGKVANSATTATSANTANAIVARDASGNFSAGTITANLAGNASSATTTNNFSGPLSGDVTGTQNATVVSTVGGQTAANVASASILANAATSTNTANAIVRRDASGNFSAGTITADLSGSASNNVLKAGDSMTGTLNMVSQNAIHFNDAAGGEYVGLQAPTTIPTSYTIALPSTIPTGNQILRANNTIPTNLEWASDGSAVPPTNGKTIYVTKFGNDTTGDGSFIAPYASVSKALSTANSIASAINPIIIKISAGRYTENNSAGPLTTSAAGITITGDASAATFIIPSTLSQNLFLATATTQFNDLAFLATAPSTASAVSLTTGSLTGFNNCRFTGFQTAVSCTGANQRYFFNNCLFVANGTALTVSSSGVECNNCVIFGAIPGSSPANTGISITGAGGTVIINGGDCTLCTTGISITNNATVLANTLGFRSNITDIAQSNTSSLTLNSCNSNITTSSSDVKIQIAGAGAAAVINGCEFNGNSALGIPQGTCLLITNNAQVTANGCLITNYTTGAQIGISTDTASTKAELDSISIQNCTNDIIQNGSAALNFNASIATTTKININDSTNVHLTFFDLSTNNTLSIGSLSDTDTILMKVEVSQLNRPTIDYKSSLYGTRGIGFENLSPTPSSWFVESQNNASFAALTTDRTKTAAVSLFSDTASPFGSTTALRGWTVTKNPSTAELAFAYQNNDLVGQSNIPQYTVLQLDGVNNQVQLPNAATKLMFNTDTNLYRSGADLLKTDDNFIVGPLTAGRAVATDPVTNQLISSTTTSAELNFLSGVTSAVQPQLNSKVAKAGDTMTGALQLPAGSAAAPSLTFTGSTTTGLSANSGNLFFSTVGAERFRISSGGTASINGFTTAGVVHNNASGDLSSSLIVNADVDPTAAIADTKLATISTAGKVANSATTATSANTASTIVARDSSGNFSAGTITANITGNVTGSASNNILKTGDTMTGTLNMASQNNIRFNDAAGGEYVGIQAPTTVPASYTLALPPTIPTANQLLRANNATPTQLEWFSDGGLVAPAASKVIYVTKYGNDVTGDGSFATPYATLAKAIGTANSLASNLNPIAIQISPGLYFENNSAGPLTVTASGISIIGESSTSVIIFPTTLSNDLLLATQSLQVAQITLTTTGGPSTAKALSLTNGTFSNINTVRIINFQTGLMCSGSSNSYGLNNCVFIANGTGLLVNDTSVACNNCTIFGSTSLTGPPANTGVSVTGANANAIFSGGTYAVCTTCFDITNNARATISAVTYKLNKFDIIQSGASRMTVVGSTFQITDSSADIDIQISGSGTSAQIIGCELNGKNLGGINEGIAIVLTDNAALDIESSAISAYDTALIIGDPLDSSSTALTANGILINDCTTDLVQNGSTSVQINSCSMATSKITINDSTNVSLAFFDLDNNNALTIGSFAGGNLDLIKAAISPTQQLRINHKGIYGTHGIGFENPTTDPSTWYVESQENSAFATLTTDRTKTAALSLFSDEGSPFGGTTALRGWTVTKNPSTAELAFAYQNNDLVGQSNIPQYTVLQLDGVNNQVQLPNAATKLMFNTDTNLYRSGADLLKTDDNFIVGPLTAGRAVATDPVTNQLISSTTTNAELGFLSGVTSAIQPQLNSKVAKAGDTMTGTLQLPAGSAAAPSLTFTGSTTTGLSANSGNLFFSTVGAERFRISSGGTVSINDAANGFTTAGVVHNNASGDLSSSLIVNADINPTAAIADTKLATISTAGKVANSATTATSTNTASTIVARDASGNFSAGTITANLIGNVTGSASNNVLKAGDTMTGTLTIPAGSAASPSLKFSGSTNTGISAPSANTLSFDTNGTQVMHIDGSGIITIDGFTNTGIVHNDASGNLSSSLIVNNDISNGTISNTKLATISSSNTSGNIVVRDGSGNFTTNMITLNGTVTNPTDAATKAYVDAATSTGLVAKTPALAVSTSNVTLSGTQTIDGVALVANDRVLLVSQTDPMENGLWLVQAGTWTRPTDFASGSTAGQAYVLITSGNTYLGSSWLCNTPTAVVDTDPLMFVEFSLPDTTTAANVGTGAGQIFKNKTGVTLNFKTIAAGQHMTVTNHSDDITLATDATSSNVINTLVSRDGTGNFSASTITANLTGNASGNVLKAGDNMTGTLNMLSQNAIRFNDAADGEYVGLQAPSTIPASYTLSLPTASPTIGQTLRAGSLTPTQLTWITEGGAVTPVTSRTVYVTTYGDDTNGDGSFDKPYATLAKAIDIANSISTQTNPVTITIAPGTYIEDNSTGPLTINSDGISVIGAAPISTILIPTTLSQDLLLVNNTVQISNLTLYAPGVSTATALSMTAGQFSTVNFIHVINFQTGIACTNSTSAYAFDSCFLNLNGIGLYINDTTVQCNSCEILGSNNTFGPPANVGIAAIGSSTLLNMSGGNYSLCTTCFDISNNAKAFINGLTLELNAQDIVQTSGSELTLVACSIAVSNDTSDLDISLSGAGTLAQIIGCSFDGRSLAGTPEGTSVSVSDNANIIISSSSFSNYATALQIGSSTDASSTIASLYSTTIQNCTNDIIQDGSATLNLNASIATGSKIVINDSTNVHLAFFDLEDNNALTIGTFDNVNTNLVQAAVSPTEHLALNYKTSLYGAPSIGFENPSINPSTWFVESQDNAAFTALTTDRTKTAALSLFSDEGSPFGSTTALRGWTVTKNPSTAELAFAYQNNDLVGQSNIPQYTVLQLDGVNNQVQLPDAATKLVFDTDTNLYRSAANNLKTDDNFIVGTLTPGRAVATDPVTNQLISSTTTNAELSFLSGVTSAIQPQLNSKVAKSGDTMTGTLQLPAGSTAAPSLTFTGSTTTGLSANSGNLFFSTVGAERFRISSGGTVSINDAANGFTTAGVVHNNTFGDLSSSLIVNADVDPAAAIADTKLATITTAGKVANSATTATSANTASTIVARDSSGNFSAGTITANLTGNVTGSASNNVLKAGDTMTGTLNMASQNSIRFNDAAGGEYVGIQAPAAVSTSYTLALPADGPSSGQTLRAGSIIPTDLEWITEGGSIAPTASRSIYVALYGNDVTGTGSFDLPFASLAKAIDLANSVATSSTPIAIYLAPGTYVENNGAGPLTITANGISIIGSTENGVLIQPSNLAQDLLLINKTILIADIAFQAVGSSTATCINCTAGSFSILRDIKITNFQTGLICTGAGGLYGIQNCLFFSNGTAISINSASVHCVNCGVAGKNTLTSTGIQATGAGSLLDIISGTYTLCQTCINISNSARCTISAVNFEINRNDIVQTSGAQLSITSTSFSRTYNSSDTEIQISGAGSFASITTCNFDGRSLLGVPQSSAITVTDNAQVYINGGRISNYTTGLTIGTNIDTASTSLVTSSVSIQDCANDIIQNGSASLNFNASIATSTKININDATNVHLAFFDLGTENALTLGSLSDTDTILMKVEVSQSNRPTIDYKSSLYGARGIGFENLSTTPSTWFVESQDNASFAALTTDRAKTAAVSLFSDTTSPFGSTTALRGWTVTKNPSTAELAFAYQNNDLVGQSNIPQYTVLQLDGVNNQVQLPDAATKLVFDADTNLYRSAANNLKTDDNFIIGTLTAGRAVATDPLTNQLISSTTTSAELDFLSGVTSAVQPQLNSKVAKAGDTMTGTLQLPGGSAAAPSLTFTGSTTTGLSANSGNLSLSTNGVERLKVSSGGTVSINGFTTAGIVHNDVNGNLSTSLIVNADVDPAAAIVDTKLATISTAGKVANSATTATSANTASTIVARDSSGDFSAGTITANLNGNATTATTATTATNATNFTGSLSGDVTGTQGATVVSTVGGQTAANVAAATVLANAATSANTANAIVRRDASGNFSAGTITANLTGTVTGSASLNVLKAGDTMTGTLTMPAGTTAAPSIQFTGSTNTGISAPVANTLSFDTNGVERLNIGSSGVVTIPNLNSLGIVHNNASGVLSTSLIVNADVDPVAAIVDTKLATITTAGKVANSATTATSANTNNAIVARDGSGNFVAGTITANLSGNATTATTATSFSGSLVGDVTGTQSATVVSTVGGQTAANVAAGAVLANAATSANTASAIVRRDASGNFAAGTITANLTGNVTGSASLNVLKTGDTMTGTLTHPAGTVAVPSIQFTGSTNTGISAPVTNTLSFDTNGVERLNIGSSGVVTIPNLNSLGIVHNNASGVLSTSLIVNADVDPVAAIVDTKLATISTAGKVANSATTATSANTLDTIVLRDGSGNFNAGTITANLNGNATSATTATTAANATNFTGSLAGDVTGTQGATVVSTVGGQTATNVASAAILANAATNTNTLNTIVKRDNITGGFAAGTITANLTGNVTGSASLNVLKTGDTMTGTLTMPAGTAATPSIQFTGSANTGISASVTNTLSFDTNGAERLNIDSTGIVTIANLNATGIVHNNASGVLSTSLVVNADIDPAAAIADTKLATISTAGKVSNSATTATSANTANAIVLRDGSNNFVAGTITASLTGSASLNVLKAGDTMTGALTLPAGSSTSPTLKFTGSTNTGISAATANTLSFDTNGTEQMNISTSAVTMLAKLIVSTLLCNQGIQTATPTNNSTVTANATTSILLLKPNNGVSNVTITFPSSPTNGQYFTIMAGNSNSIALVNSAPGNTVVNGVTSLNTTIAPLASTGGASVTYVYYTADLSWYRIYRG